MDRQYSLVDPPGSSPEHLLDVSIGELLSRPQDFHGKYVRVAGFYRGEFEGTALYETLDDGWRTDRSMWVTILPPLHNDDCSTGLPDFFNRRYISAEGRFDAKETGHMGMWPAGLDVKYITILHTDQLSENRTGDEMGIRFNYRYGADGEE